MGQVISSSEAPQLQTMKNLWISLSQERKIEVERTTLGNQCGVELLDLRDDESIEGEKGNLFKVTL